MPRPERPTPVISAGARIVGLDDSIVYAATSTTDLVVIVSNTALVLRHSLPGEEFSNQELWRALTTPERTYYGRRLAFVGELCGCPRHEGRPVFHSTQA